MKTRTFWNPFAQDESNPVVQTNQSPSVQSIQDGWNPKIMKKRIIYNPFAQAEPNPVVQLIQNAVVQTNPVVQLIQNAVDQLVQNAVVQTILSPYVQSIQDGWNPKITKKRIIYNPFAQAEPNPVVQTLRKVEFGKSELPLSYVCDIKKLMDLGNSVCRLVIGNHHVRGTGFVLLDRMILTNAHLFKGIDWTEEEGLLILSVPILAQFNYEDRTSPQPISFCVTHIIDIDADMDYAVLLLKAEPGKSVPPGLLKHFGSEPKCHSACCIIGHPEGDMKKMDLTSVIGKCERVESADRKLLPYDNPTQLLIMEHSQKQGINQLLTSDQVITYDTSMFHGSSGSPVFDADCKVVAMHSGGFLYQKNQSIIEYAYPVKDIFKKIVGNLTRRWNLLPGEIIFLTQDNPELIRILKEAGLWKEPLMI